MPDPVISPATEAAPLVEAPQPAPTNGTVKADALPSAPTAEKSTTDAAPTPQEPDYKSLTEKFLQTPEGKRYLLDHPAIKGEVDHRVKSTRDADVQSKIEAALAQERQRNRAELDATRKAANDARDTEELRRLIEDDPTSPLAQRMRTQLVEKEREQLIASERARLVQELMPVLQSEVAAKAGNWWLDMLAGQVDNDDSLSDEEKAGLNPRDPKWATPQDFFTAWRKLSTDKSARKIAKELADVEATAREAAWHRQSRTKEQGPTSLPAGTAGETDQDFLRIYAAGKSNDHARARTLIGI